MLSKQKLFLLLFLSCFLRNGQTSEDLLDVIIIGAGASGIAAASRLYQSGVKFILLEAESRIGGRVYSVPFGDAIVDLGAEWVHGEKGNIVYEMMKATDLLHHSKQSYRIYSSDRQEISEEVSLELLDIFNNLYAVEDGNSTINDSVSDYFIPRYIETINKKYGNDKRILNFAIQAMTMFEKYVCSLESSPNWHLPSAIADFVDSEGDSSTHWNGKGYFSALEFIMNTTTLSSSLHTYLQKNKVVNRIEYGGDKVVVKGDNFEYSGKYVVFTPSLGVLKHSHRELFSPPLSDKKADAIDRIGFGAVAKVWMHFENPWWSNVNISVYSFVWNSEDRLTLLTQFSNGPKKNGQIWLNDLYSVISTPENPKVLSAWFAGEFISEMETMPDDVLVDGIMFAMNKFLGHIYHIERPDKIERGKWSTNKHFRGTYTYQTTASRKMGGIQVLAEPVKNLLFSGEATNIKHFSTVHGAIESGFREADRLIKIFNSTK